MKTFMNMTATAIFITVLFACSTFASSDMEGHDMASQDRIGELIHESVVDGYMLAYHFMDLRDQKGESHAGMSTDESHDMEKNDMEKPHHLMVYIMNKRHKPVMEGKVGFLVKKEDGQTQKAMGMFMSKGFGTTLDMKEKGTYKITTKALVDGKTLMDSFEYEIK